MGPVKGPNNDAKLILNDSDRPFLPLDHLGSIWYHSEPSEVSYSAKKKLLEHFFVGSTVFCIGSNRAALSCLTFLWIFFMAWLANCDTLGLIVVDWISIFWFKLGPDLKNVIFVLFNIHFWLLAIVAWYFSKAICIVLPQKYAPNAKKRPFAN